MGVVQAGAMHVVHDDGTEEDVGHGEAYVIEPGHNAWVVGDEPLIGSSLSRAPLRSTPADSDEAPHGS